MAKRKASIVQKDFGLGVTRTESIERDDTPLLNRSVEQGTNTLILATGSMECRPGTYYLQTVTGKDGIEIEPESGQIFILTPVAGGLKIFDSTGVERTSFATATWTLSEDIWINNLGDTILLGSQTSPIHALTYEEGAFSFGLFTFADGPGGSLNQPYWAFEPGISITPSALTGSVTITASEGVFTQAHVGVRIRYVQREITITAVASPTSATGTVVTELAPTKVLTVDDTSGFQVGEACEHSSLGGQGIITDISGSDITVLVTQFFTGFDGNSANLVAPNAKSNITANTDAGSPASTTLWDEALISPARGYPGWSTEHKGKVILCDFPQAPNVFAASATGTVNDFLVGTNEDDAIVDTISASRSLRIRYAVSVEDLILLTSQGCFYQETRDGTIFSPDNFDPVKFDNMGVAGVPPAKVNDGVAFVAANGSNVMGAILQGDIYKAWSITPLSNYHSGNIVSPIRLTATENDSDRPERFIFCINSDGTAAIMRWERGPSFSQDTIGWVPWVTSGSFLAMFMAFGKIHAIIERTINGTTSRYLERFDPDAVLDCSTLFTGSLYSTLVDENGDAVADENGDVLVEAAVSAGHLYGETVAVYLGGFDEGDFSMGSNGLPVDGDGNVIDLPDGDVQVGLTFTMTIQPWARRSVDGYAGRREAQRIIRLTVMVQDTLAFTINNVDYGGYRAGEDLSAAPPFRTEHMHYYPGTRDHYQELIIAKTRPGPFRMTGLNFKVQL